MSDTISLDTVEGGAPLMDDFAGEAQPFRLASVLRDLSSTIQGRWDADPKTSYTAQLLTGDEDRALKKVAEEAVEVVMAAKDNDHDHIRYEAADLVYHLMVVLERYGITADELADELASRTSCSGLEEKASRGR